MTGLVLGFASGRCPPFWGCPPTCPGTKDPLREAQHSQPLSPDISTTPDCGLVPLIGGVT